MPTWQDGAARYWLLVGTWGERRSPVRTFSETLYAAMTMPAGAEVVLPDAPERGLYVVNGAVSLLGEVHRAGRMVVLRPGAEITLKAVEPARCALIGGAPLGERFMFWNFVSTRRERIEQAKADWAAERFAVVPGDEAERIPLPD